MADVLQDALLGLSDTRIDPRIDQVLLVIGLESDEGRRINAVCQIYAKGPDRGAVTNPKTDGMHHVVEVLQVALLLPQGEVAPARINIAQIMKRDAADIFADQRKAQFRLIEQQRRAAERESRGEVARSRLVFIEAAVRRTAAAEETLRQRYRGKRIAAVIERINIAEAGAARQH